MKMRLLALTKHYVIVEKAKQEKPKISKSRDQNSGNHGEGDSLGMVGFKEKSLSPKKSV